MELTIIGPVLISLVFGAFVALVELLIGGGLTLRGWASKAFAYACFCYIILFGVIRI